MVAAAVIATAGGGAGAATVRLGGQAFDSEPGYSISRSGTDVNGQFASASADEIAGAVSGRLVGPNAFLTAGFNIEALTGNRPLGAHYTVNGLRAGSELTFVWRLHGDYSGVADAQAFRMEAFWTLYNGRNLWSGGFDRLSFIDGPPSQGDFAGLLNGTFICPPNPNSQHALCGQDWNARGERFVSLRDSSDEGWLRSSVEVAGSGLDTIASYGIELWQVLAEPDAFAMPASAAMALLHDATAPAYLQFDSGLQFPITSRQVQPNAVPEPGLPLLLLAGLAALGGTRQARHMAPARAGA